MRARVWVAAIALCSSAAHAEFYTGNDVYERMRSPNEVLRVESLLYIAGVVDTLRGVITCPPASVTLGQIFDMVKKYHERNPEHRSRSGDHAVATVMRAAWPCKSGAGT